MSSTTQDEEPLSYKDENTLRRLYHEKGLSGREIADRLDCGQRTVFRWMEKFGIEREDKIEALKHHHRVEYADYRMKDDGHYIWLAVYEGKNEQMYVGRLLAVAEYGIDAVKGKHAHHKNGIPWDNRPGNIELMSPGEHTSHHCQGEDHPNSKLTEETVRQIKKVYETSDKSLEEVGEEFGTSRSNVSLIVNGEAWQHVFE